MAASQPGDIRNIALLGHSSSGKTTLGEAILFKTGVSTRQGSVNDGTSLLDFTDMEKERQHSVDPAMVSVEHAGKKINIIDAPGYPDFVGVALQVMAGIDTCVIVVSGVSGVEVNTRRMFKAATSAGMPVAIVVNKIHGENVDLNLVLNSINETFGASCRPVNLPSGDGVLDCFTNTEGDSELGSVAEAHEALIENIVESDEEMMEAYLGGEEITPAKLSKAFGSAMVAGTLIPIFFTDARDSVGVEEFLDAAARLFPAAGSVSGAPVMDDQGEEASEVEITPDPSKPFVGQAFKITTDPFVGKLTWVRVLQGTASGDTQFVIGGEKKGSKIGHLFQVMGGKTEEIKQAVAGDIFAVAKFEDISTGDVMHAAGKAMYRALPAVPTPMFALAATPKKRGDEKKISEAFSRLSEEDPTFQPSRDTQTHETIISGMGDLHLRMMLQKMKDRFNIEVDTKTPKIPYRETIMQEAKGHYRHKKQTGGAGQFGEVYLRVEPLERDGGFEYVSELFGESIPRQFLPAIEKGIRGVLEFGAIAGYPMQDIKVAITDGKHHPVDSKEIAFKTAGKFAFLDAIDKAKPALLEPFVQMEITIPADNMGDIASDLSGRRGRIQGQDMLPGNITLVKALAPLAEVRQYNNQLKSVTGGQGSFTMELSHYEQVPGNVQQEIVAAAEKERQEQEQE